MLFTNTLGLKQDSSLISSWFKMIKIIIINTPKIVMILIVIVNKTK